MEKQGQNDGVAPLFDDSCVLINLWNVKRRDYIYLYLFGDGSDQCEGDKVGIMRYIGTYSWSPIDPDANWN